MGLLKKLTQRWTDLGRRRSFALNELDLRLERYLDFDGGFFVEAGANDGVQQSNTLYFERYRRWRGLLIEPIPELARRCRRNRRRCAVVQAALVPAGFAGHTIEMRFCNLMSVVKGGMKSPAEEKEHIRQGCEVQSIDSHEVTVPARTLSSILDELGISQVDLLSLDVEGFELQALRGLDLQRHGPRHLLVEARYRTEIDECLASHYEILAELSHHDVLYQRRAA